MSRSQRHVTRSYLRVYSDNSDPRKRLSAVGTHILTRLQNHQQAQKKLGLCLFVKSALAVQTVEMNDKFSFCEFVDSLSNHSRVLHIDNNRSSPHVHYYLMEQAIDFWGTEPVWEQVLAATFNRKSKQHQIRTWNSDVALFGKHDNLLNIRPPS